MNIIGSWILFFTLNPLIRIFYIKDVKGENNIPKGNFIFVSNHQSFLDLVVNGCFCVPRRFRFIGQTDQYVGVERFWRDVVYFLAGTIGMDRKDSTSKKTAMQKAAEYLKKGEIICIYPEGTRSRTGETGRGKKGAASLYLETGVPILPAALAGAFELLPPGTNIKGMKIRKEIRVNIGTPLYFTQEYKRAQEIPKDSEEYLAMLDKITDKMMSEIVRLKEELIKS